MGDSPEFMPLDRHLFNDFKLACRRNVSLTRMLPDEDRRKFWFNTPKRAFHSLARTWQYSPSGPRIVEDILEFFESIDLVVESKGVYVDLNVRNGRRLLNFSEGSPAQTIHKRSRPMRTKEASIKKLNDLHPDTKWCSDSVLAFMKEKDLKVEATDQDLKNITAPIVDPEELLLEYEAWDAVQNPPAEHTMALCAAIDPEADKAKAEDRALKKDMAKAAAALKRRAKAAGKGKRAQAKLKAPKQVKGKSLPPPKKKRKTKKKEKEFPGFEDYYPPSGHPIEFEWDGVWFEGFFVKMVIDEDGDELCHVRDAGTNEIHKILFREQNNENEWEDLSEWVPLFNCPYCEMNTRGFNTCEECKFPKDCSDSESE